jgi:plasmid maintenance system antidote protein VapI
MNYEELIVKALKGRTVTEAARNWGVHQPTLDRWLKGQRMPNFNTALRIAKEAEVDPGEAFEVFAEQERLREVKNFKLQMGFVQNGMLPLLLTCAALADFILCKTAHQNRTIR